MREMVAVFTILMGFAGMAHAQASETSNQAIVLLIDTSGSMRNEARLAYARETAKAVARQLKDSDLFGVIGFNLNPYTVVSVDQMANARRVVDAQIDRLKADGQTDFLRALIEANKSLDNWTASKKHVVLLSDGITRGSYSAILKQVSDMLKANINVSTVAIGSEADVKIMSRMARSGGGFFQVVCYASTMPQLMVEQLFSATGSSQPNFEAQECPSADTLDGAMKADLLGFPPPGTKWIGRSVSETGVATTYLYTVLEEGTYEGTAVHRVSAGPYTQVYEKASGNFITNLLDGKETQVSLPQQIVFAGPLYAGKTWTTYYDRRRGTIINSVVVNYQVQGWESVVTPGGTWNALRVQSKSADGNSVTTYWYAPDTKLTVKWINETTLSGVGVAKSAYEIIEYPAKRDVETNSSYVLPDNPNYSSYLNSIREKVFSSWTYPGDDVSGVVTVVLAVDGDGRLLAAQVLDSTDDRLITPALEAVKSASPFPLIPDELKALAGVPLKMKFTVEMKRR